MLENNTYDRIWEREKGGGRRERERDVSYMWSIFYNLMISFVK